MTSFFKRVFGKKMTDILKDDSTPQPNADAEPGQMEGANTLDADTAERNEEAARLQDSYARALADLDNYRRRAAREKEEIRKYANQNLLEDLIPMLDNLGIGLATAEKHPEAAPVTEGFRMIAAQLKNVLEQHGLREINPVGDSFDPNAHESVSQAPHDSIPDNHVISVLRIGYHLHGRLVRPASVILSTGAPSSEATVA
jgi:molecular chaperone GrpE